MAKVGDTNNILDVNASIRIGAIPAPRIRILIGNAQK